MEKAVNYEMQERREGDSLQLISGSLTPNSNETWARTDRKEAKRTSCMQQCCMIFIAMIAVLALCAAAAAIVLVLAYPNVANPGVQEVLVLKDQLTAQLASTSAPSTDAGIASLSEELRMIRETIQASLTSMDTSLQASLNSIDTSLQASLNTIGTSIESSLNATTSSIKASVSSVTSLGEEVRMIREALEVSLTSTDTSIQATLSLTSSSIESSLNSVGTSFVESVNSMSTLLERLVEGEVEALVRRCQAA